MSERTHRHESHSGAARNGRVEVVTLPAWKVRWSARAPRVLAAVVGCVLMAAGLRAIVAGPPEPAPTPGAARAGDQAAETFAEGFVRAYLSWDPAAPELREQLLARFVGPAGELDVGVDPRAAQTVSWTAVVGSRVVGPALRTVTVRAQTDRQDWYIAVRVRRDGRGALAIAGAPAIVGPPPTVSGVQSVSEEDVEDVELKTVAERAVRNYVGGQRQNLGADIDRGAVLSLPSVRGTVEAVEGVTRLGDGRVAVTARARVADATLALRYELTVVRRERWYVRAIETDPRLR